MENIVEKTKDIVNTTEDGFNNGMITIIDFLKNNLSGFITFLLDKNIVQTGIGIIIATQISKLTNIFVDTIINPIVNKITLGTVDDINQWEINLFDINIKIGIIISSIINFLLIALIIYNVWKLSQNTKFDFINDLLEESKNSFDKTKTKVVINIGAPVQ